MRTVSIFLSSAPPVLSLPIPISRIQPFPNPTLNLRLHLFANSTPWPSSLLNAKPRRDFTARADDADVEAGAGDDYDMDVDADELEELDNKKDYDVEYDRLLGLPVPREYDGAAGDASPDDIEMVHSDSFVPTEGWDPDTVVDYRINEDEFHKISLLHCDFFIRKPPGPDDNVYDFREMYVTPPDMDVYSIPKVLAPMPKKYIRCSKSDYGRYNVTEPPIDAPRDPLYKSEREVLKILLTKHYRNRRLNDPEFVLDFEEIYVIDSKSKSITRAKVIVTIPEGRKRDRRNDMLIIRDNGTYFKIIDKSEKEEPDTVIEREEWIETREEMERHLRKLRDFHVSNWF